jgi:hypothetical protein
MLLASGEASRSTLHPRAVEATIDERWGWLPALSLIGALGLLLVAVADSGARESAAWAEVGFWSGLLTLFMPIAVRLISDRATRRERLGLVVVLGIGLYLVKVLHSPLNFTFYDEFSHWRTAENIISSQHLFDPNPLLKISPSFPGLEILTTALSNLTGLTIFEAGILVIAVGRLLFTVTLFLLFEQIGCSTRAAGIASLVYICNPSYVFFDAQFSYESLALPIAALALLAIVRRQNAADNERFGLNLVAVLAIGALVVVHHVTTYALLAFLVLWTLATLYIRRGRANLSYHQITALIFALALTWLVYVASLTIGYLAPVFSSAVIELLRLIAGESMGRELFRAPTGHVSSLWEQALSFGSVLIILLGLAIGWLHIWRKHRESPLALTLAVAALAYPGSLALRLTQAGAETSNRASGFVFIAIGYVLAVGIVERWTARRLRWIGTGAFAILAAAIFAGGIIVGWAPTSRIPGPYIVAADPRSVEPESITAAEWARAALGPGRRMLADRTNRQIMGAYAAEDMVVGYTGDLHVAQVFFSTEFGPVERAILRGKGVRYLLIDRRLSSALPMVGVYLERNEPNNYRHTTPIAPEALAKFDRQPGVSRIFDSGDIVIYDVGDLAHAP